MTASPLQTLIQRERRKQARALGLAAACAAGLAAAGIGLLGLSGAFLTGAALAGMGGAVAAFNYLLPAAGVRFLAIARTASRYGERVFSHEAALKALAHIRPTLFYAVATGPVQSLNSLSTGEATARLTQDVDVLETLLVRRSGRWGLTAALVIGVSIACLVGWRAALALLALMLCGLAAGWWVARRLCDQPGVQIQIATGELKDHFIALSTAAPELACYGLFDWAADEISAHADGLLAARRRNLAGRGALAALALALPVLAAALVFAFAGAARLPMILLAVLAAMAAMEPMAAIFRSFEQDGAVRTAMARLDPLLTARGEKPSGGRPAPTPILFSDKTGVWRSLPIGGRLAVLGSSGAGKTTWLETLLHLRPVIAGRVRIGAADLAEVSRDEARRLFAYCPQDVQLLAGTVRDNLSMADPSVNETIVWDALEDAGLAAFVRNLPSGLDTWVGADGCRLSGGERRRLSLARAFVRPAPWLLLDEPTEGLDDATQFHIVKRLSHRIDRTGQGLIIVTHRASVAALADQSVFIEDGLIQPHRTWAAA